MKTIRFGSRGFTLIELLVVIGIIALLAALLVPSVMSGMQKSKRAYCLNSLNQIGKANIRIANDGKGGAWATGATMKDVVIALSNSMDIVDAKLWWCPSDRRDEGGVASAAAAISATFDTKVNCSYAYLAGWNDRVGLQPTTTPALVDESNVSDIGTAPTALKDLTKDDNHGSNYRNILYFDGHTLTLNSGKASDTYKESGSPSDSAWQLLKWVD